MDPFHFDFGFHSPEKYCFLFSGVNQVFSYMHRRTIIPVNSKNNFKNTGMLLRKITNFKLFTDREGGDY